MQTSEFTTALGNVTKVGGDQPLTFKTPDGTEYVASGVDVHVDLTSGQPTGSLVVTLDSPPAPPADPAPADPSPVPAGG